MYRIALLLCVFVLVSGLTFAQDIPPWKTNSPIADVKKELYRKHDRPGTSVLASMQYVGPGLERREVQSSQTLDDVSDDIVARWSSDNGKTWSEFVKVQPSNNINYNGVTVWEGEACSVYAPKPGVLVQMWLRQIQEGKLYHCWTYSRYSRDAGRTWSTPKQLRYEDGEDFDPNEPMKATYLDRNEAYIGSNIEVLPDGTLLHCVAHANAPGDPKNNERIWRMGSVMFSGVWDDAAQDFVWTAGAHVEINPEMSARGLMEPEVVQLKDGRILVVWRGSTEGWDGTKATIPGRKFFSVSTDGGKTLTAPGEWKYDDGTSFYSPSSFHRMIRHSVTGKLYWFGNITPEPPAGNMPRYPLVIAEVDEEKAALKKSTVTVVDDRQPDQGKDIQFSNFSLLEDRETHALELYMTLYGQFADPAEKGAGDCYKYVLTIR
ncbi:MAG: glycoside hydrolase [Candidatus Hydrogenedentes bacterium]|nr:glycoside hydrolase [Candidatus Hydrogenedentota bacterium]